MGNQSSRDQAADPGVFTVVSGHRRTKSSNSYDDPLNRHPDLDLLLRQPRVRPLLTPAEPQRLPAVPRPLPAEPLRELASGSRHALWSAHLQVSENQRMLLHQVDVAVDRQEQVLAGARENLQMCRGTVEELSGLGRLSKSLEESYLELQRALVGIQAVRSMLPEDIRNDLPVLEELIGVDSFTGCSVNNSPKI